MQTGKEFGATEVAIIVPVSILKHRHAYIMEFPGVPGVSHGLAGGGNAFFGCAL